MKGGGYERRTKKYSEKPAFDGDITDRDPDCICVERLSAVVLSFLQSEHPGRACFHDHDDGRLPGSYRAG